MKEQEGQFYSDQIQVTPGEKPGTPAAFIWRGRQYNVREIWGQWPDYSFGPLTRGRWWQRRHRTYFRVVTDEDEVFEIYLDRGGREKRWYLYRRRGRASGSSQGGE
jgi:hypothetical protein